MSGQTAHRLLGDDPESAEFDLNGIQASLGLEASATGTTNREFQNRGHRSSAGRMRVDADLNSFMVCVCAHTGDWQLSRTLNGESWPRSPQAGLPGSQRNDDVRRYRSRDKTSHARGSERSSAFRGDVEAKLLPDLASTPAAPRALSWSTRASTVHITTAKPSSGPR